MAFDTYKGENTDSPEVYALRHGRSQYTGNGMNSERCECGQWHCGRDRTAELEQQLAKSQEEAEGWKHESRLAEGLADELQTENKRLASTVNALSADCKRLEDDREYNAQLVQERDRRIAELETALRRLVYDVAQYEAWQRPCFAVTEASNVLSKK